MKGIILAGGSGSRLMPLTKHISKQLLPVYNKPMIYYPLSTLMLAGVNDICLICTPRDLESFKSLFGNGSQFGISITYLLQENPRGIAEAFLIAEDFLEGSKSILILGDNIFYGSGLGRELQNRQIDCGARIFGYEVSNPSDFGIVELDSNGRVLNLVEKPTQPNSKTAITGLYFLDETATSRAKSISPSLRGELEIVSLLNSYLNDDLLIATKLPRGTAWLDTGTFDGLHKASSFVQVLEDRTGLSIGDPEDVARTQGWIA